MDLTDIELMEKVKEGDNHSFELLVMRHQGGLVNYFFRLCWNRSFAEDQAQETFLRLYESRTRYQPASKFTTYLYRIARNLWIDYVRRMSRRGTPVSLEVSLNDEGTLRDILPAQDRGDARAKDVVEKMERVMQAVNSLNESQRELFTLVRVKHLKYQEIGEILGIPEGTVKTRMHALMKKLRHALVEAQ